MGATDFDIKQMASKVQAIVLLSSDDENTGLPSSIEEWSAPRAKRRRLSPEPHRSALPRPSPPAPRVNTHNWTFKKPSLATTDVQDFDVFHDIDDDPIEFTSSVGQNASQTKSTNRRESSPSSDDDSLPDLFTNRGASNDLSKGLSSRTAALLASIDNQNPQTTAKSSSTTTRQSPKKKRSLTESERQARERAKEADKEAKAQEKAEAKKRRAKEREEDEKRRKEKRAEAEKEKKTHAAFVEANKADKIKKEVSTKDMILDMPESFLGSKRDYGLHEQCKRLNVDVTVYQSPVPDVVKWRRKAKQEWNAEKEYWEPLPSVVVKDEPHILCLVPAATFVALATGTNISTSASTPASTVADTLDTHVAKLRSAYPPSSKLIYMIEGLTGTGGLLSKSKNAENRAYQAQVRGDVGPRNAKKKKEVTIVDDAAVDAALLRLQLHHKCLIHYTKDGEDSVKWIMAFTQHISTVPYRQQHLNLQTTFSMESGQVRTGANLEDTFLRMLEESIVRVTPAISLGIQSRYDSIPELVKGFREEGPLVLEELRKHAVASGAFTNRNIGPSISRRIYKILTEWDPESTDV